MTGERQRFSLPCLSTYFPESTYFSEAFFARSSLACLVAVGMVKTTTAHLFHLAERRTKRSSLAWPACLVIVKTKNKTQECKIFYIFISSVHLKSLVQTNQLLVRRREFTSCLPCLYMCDGFLTSKPRLTVKLDNLASEQIRTYSYLSRILILTVSLVEAHKESRQKRLAIVVFSI